MKLLKFSNKTLMMLVTDTAMLKSPSETGNSITLALDDNKNMAENDFLLIGEIGSPKSEIIQISSAVTLGTAVVADTLTFPHNAGTPVYKIPFNQVRFYRAATLAGAKSLLSGGTITMDAQNEFTTYADSTNTTGFLFFTLYNSETAVESDYSAGFDYEAIPYGSRIKIREIVTSKHFWAKEIDDDTFNTLCDFAESEIFAIRRWRFRENSDTFNTVADQQSYTPVEMGITDLGQLLFATYAGDPLLPINMKQHQHLNRNPTVVSGTPRYILEWDGNVLLTPTPSAVGAVILYYYRNSAGFENETVESSVKLPQAIAFRILQDLWAMVDANKSQYFERRYLQVIAAMKLDDVKQVSRFQTLTDSRMDGSGNDDQVEHPTIEV